MRKLSILLIITALSTLMGCSSGYEKYNEVYMDTFDTVVEFTAYTEDAESFRTLSGKVHSRLTQLTQLFDIYNSYDNMNNLKTINDNAGIAPVRVDNELLELIKAGKQAYTDTDGTINIAMGSVLRLWHDCREAALANPAAATLPSDEALREASKHTSIDNIVIDEASSTIYITDKDASIDVGAIAKGYTSELIIEMLRADGVDSALLNMGGNVAALNGTARDKWTIGITDPREPEKSLNTIEIANQYAISSGNYQRYFEYNSKRYHHIIDPQTLYPADNNKGVTVICDSGTRGDMLSTALFILPVDKGRALAEKFNAKAEWVTSEDKIESN